MLSFIVYLRVGLSMRRGGRDAHFLAPPHTPAICKNCTPRTAQNEENPCCARREVQVVRGYVGLIPRYMRNQTKAIFLQEPNKKIIFKQITKARFKQITKKDERSEGNHSIPVLKRASTIFPPFPVSSSTLIWSFITSPQDWRLG
jgi:hypothetical protein